MLNLAISYVNVTRVCNDNVAVGGELNLLVSHVSVLLLQTMLNRCGVLILNCILSVDPDKFLCKCGIYSQVEVGGELYILVSHVIVLF